MDITGRITQKLAIQKGTSARGEWQKQEFVIEYQEGQYPSSICFNLWGDKVNELSSFNIGDQIKVYFNISSREYNGKWYNDLRAWRIEKVTDNGGYDAHSAPQPASAPAVQEAAAEPEEDDLPF